MSSPQCLTLSSWGWLSGVLRAVGLCGKGQGLPAELKVAEGVVSLPSGSHPLMSCLLWSLSDVMHLATRPKIPSLWERTSE